MTKPNRGAQKKIKRRADTVTIMVKPIDRAIKNVFKSVCARDGKTMSGGVQELIETELGRVKAQKEGPPTPNKVKGRPAQGEDATTSLMARNIPVAVNSMFRALCYRRGLTLTSGVRMLIEDKVRQEGYHIAPPGRRKAAVITQDDDS